MTATEPEISQAVEHIEVTSGNVTFGTEGGGNLASLVPSTPGEALSERFDVVASRGDAK